MLEMLIEGNVRHIPQSITHTCTCTYTCTYMYWGTIALVDNYTVPVFGIPPPPPSWPVAGVPSSPSSHDELAAAPGAGGSASPEKPVQTTEVYTCTYTYIVNITHNNIFLLK